MKGWTMPIQSASYRGVRFDVLEVSNSFDREIVEHSYPFVNGADLEDMGLAPHQVQIQAIFFGEGYYIELKRFLSAIQKRGADVLVHPVLGRMPNMICYSASIKHEADYINYALLDLSFKEATPAKPIFLFNSSLMAQIDKLLSQLENIISSITDLFSSLMEVVAFVYNVKSRLLRCWAALFSIADQLTSLFGMDKTKYHLPVAVNVQNFNAQSQLALRHIIDVVTMGITNDSISRRALTARGRFDEVLRLVQAITQIPVDLVSGKNEQAHSASFFSQQSMAQIEHFKTEKALKSGNHAAHLSTQDVAEIHLALQLVCGALLAQTTVEMIEEKADTLVPTEIEYMTNEVRAYLVNTIEQIRAIQQNDMQESHVAQPNSAIYTASQQVIEQLRQIAAEINQLAVNAINRKPPLMVKECEIDGTIHQIAHWLYGDCYRATELLRLNPHINQPNFIARGELINAYTE